MQHNTSDEIIYGTFWERVGAYLLDAIIIGVPAFALNYSNIMHIGSFWFYVLISVLGILYKPYLEYKYGATLGKMIVHLKVVDLQFQKIDFEKSLLRSFILVFPSLLYIPFHYLAFQNDFIMDAESFMDFSARLAMTYPWQKFISYLSFFIIITDVIVLVTDETKTGRSLHDRIAKTYVIKTTL